MSWLSGWMVSAPPSRQHVAPRCAKFSRGSVWHIAGIRKNSRFSRCTHAQLKASHRVKQGPFFFFFKEDTTTDCLMCLLLMFAELTQFQASNVGLNWVLVCFVKPLVFFPRRQFIHSWTEVPFLQWCFVAGTYSLI